MLAAMSRLVRLLRPCLLTGVLLTLVLGINGLDGAIHSVHHLAPPSHADEPLHHEENPGPSGGATTATCDLATAVAQLTAAEVQTLPEIGSSLARLAGMVVTGPDILRSAWVEPARGRAPPPMETAST
jgi:hypothetical protein